MVTMQVKAKRKKTSKGQRTHVRRMKQEARKGPILDNRVNKKTQKIESIQKTGSPIVQ